MKIVKLNNKNPDYYKDYNYLSFFNISELSNIVRFNELNVDLLNAAIFHETNHERIKSKIPICSFHSKLLDLSMLHSLQMKLFAFFSHENQFERKYRTLSDRLGSLKSESFVGFMCVGENISDMKYFTSANFPNIGISQPLSYLYITKQVVEGWMNSEGHRLNILNPDFRFLGCGCVPYKINDTHSNQEGLKITQNFGGDLISTNAIIFEPQKSKIKIVKKPR